MPEINLSPENLKYTYYEELPVEEAGISTVEPGVLTDFPFAAPSPGVPSIQPLFPQRTDWIKDSFVYPPFTLAANDDKEIWSFDDEDGWIQYVMIKSDSSDVTLIVQAGNAVEEMKISDAHSYGYDNSNAGVPFWVSKYSASDGYVLNFTPRPEQPYNNIIKISVRNEGTTSATISIAKMIKIVTL